MPRMYGRDDQPIPGYRLSEFLGRGGFGEVWKASAPGGTECAIKIINLGDKQGLKEFRAIRLVKRIHHPHLTPIIAFWLKDEQGNILEDAGEADSMWLKGQEAELIIAMGLGDKNLADRLKECRNEAKQGIPAEELLDYMEEAAKAIDFLNQPRHDLGSGPVAIQHCDIKPQNILIVGGSAQVCDFGLARQLNDARRTSMAAGTYAYIAPESIENKSSKTNDQYSLAISYVELRTGYLPFSANSLYEVMFAHLQGKLDFSRVTEAERPVLKRATAVAPEQRFPSTLEMVKALRKAVEGKITSKPELSLSGKSREMMRPGMEIVPGYKLVSFIGRGGYGEVWKTMAPGERVVALKIIRHLEAAGGKQEFKALELLKSVDHNHLMEVHAYWLLDNTGAIIPDELRKQGDAPPASTMVIATKLASKNLLERLHECKHAQGGEGGIPLPELLGYMRQAADAIDYLNTPQHLLGDRSVSIQHRDIKPENILLAANTVKVTDFGLAKVMEGASAVIHQDSAGLTLSYAAPEVFSNKVTSWSDQYSLAVTYFQLRIGTLPFRASSPTQIFMTHVEGKLELHPLPEGERAVIARATSVEPSKRFPTCMDMVGALEEACGLANSGLSGPTSRPDSKSQIPEKSAPDTGRRVPATGPKSTKPAASSPSEPAPAALPSQPKTAPSLPSAPVGPKSAPSTPGSGRPSEGTKPSPSEPPPTTPSLPAVKPEFNPYVTLTTDAPMVPPPASETKQDTAPGVPFEVDTDPPPPLEPFQPTLEEIKPEPTVTPWLPSEPEIKAPPLQSEWTKPVIPLPRATPRARPGASKKIVKMVVAAFVVGALLGGGIYLISMLIPKPPVPPTLAAQIATLIEDGQYRAAYDKLQAHKADLTGKEIDDLHKKNAEEWLQSVRREITEHRYKAADSTLRAMLACYRPDEETGGLQQEIKQRLARLKQLQDQLQQHITTKEWKKALAAAKEFDKDFPEEKEATQKSRDAAITYGIDSCRQQIDEASHIKDWSEACKQFGSVYQDSNRIEGYDSKKGGALEKEVLDGWIKYGKSLLTDEPEHALAVAKNGHQAAPGYMPWKDFEKEANDGVRWWAELEAVRKLLKEFSDALDDGSAKAAHDALAPLVEGIGKLSQNNQKAHMLNRLAEKSEEVLKLALEKRAPPDEVLTLVTALEEVTELKPVTFEWSLAKALAQAQLGHYTNFRKEFAKAEKATIREHPELLGQVLAAVAKQAREDEKIATSDLTGILDECMELQKVPGAAGDKLVDDYRKLLDKLVRVSLKDLKEPAQFQSLLRYCRETSSAIKASPLVRACYAECLLLQKDTELKTVTKADLADAKEATKDAGGAAEEPYVLYVRGLVKQAQYLWEDAARDYQQAFFREAQPYPWQNETRANLAVTTCFAASNEDLKKDAEQDFPFYQAAKKLQKAFRLTHAPVPPDYWRNLEATAYEGKRFAVCEEVTGKLLSEGLEKLGKEAPKLLLHSAQSREHLKRRDLALDRYEELLQARLEKKLFLEELPPVELYNQALEPAVRLSLEVLADSEAKGKKDPMAKARVARFSGLKGILLLEHPYEKDWQFPKGTMREAADAFDLAIEKHPDKRASVMATYYARHGFALAGISPVNLEAMQKDADKALDIDDKELRGWDLKAACFRIQALRAPRLSKALVDGLEKSNQTYADGIAKAKEVPESDDFVSSFHADRSINCVHLGSNRGATNRQQIKADLEMAEREAQLAIDSSPKSELAWNTLANAREDLAWSRLGNQPEYYPKAQTAFKEWARLHPASWDAYVGRARCYIRWAEDVPQEKDKAGAAAALLKDVLTKSPRHVEANYWMGYFQWKAGDRNEALQSFAKAIQHPTQGWSWLVGVGNVIGRTRKDWDPLFRIVLPDNPEEYREEHAPALYKRAQLISTGPAEDYTADLKGDEPRVIADAEAAARLAKDAYYKCQAYGFAANAHELAVAHQKDKDVKLEHRDKARQNLRRLLAVDPGAWEWAEHFALILEAWAKDPSIYVLKERQAFLDEAIQCLKKAIPKTPEGEEYKRLTRLLNRLEQMTLGQN